MSGQAFFTCTHCGQRRNFAIGSGGGSYAICTCSGAMEAYRASLRARGFTFAEATPPRPSLRLLPGGRDQNHDLGGDAA